MFSGCPTDDVGPGIHLDDVSLSTRAGLSLGALGQGVYNTSLPFIFAALEVVQLS